MESTLCAEAGEEKTGMNPNLKRSKLDLVYVFLEYGADNDVLVQGVADQQECICYLVHHFGGASCVLYIT